MATEEANPEDYPAEEINDEEDGAEEMNTESEKPEKDVKSAEDRTIFVKNLPFDATVEHIKTLFVNATDVRILTKNNGSSRGKAFVEMKDVASAEKVFFLILSKSKLYLLIRLPNLKVGCSMVVI